MSKIIRAAGYTNSIQQLVMPVGFSPNVTAYLWGGGGGGGGNDANRGGNGCGAMCVAHTFTVAPGDIIEVAVGQAGQRGLSQQTGGGSGLPGAAYTLDVEIFSTLDIVNQPSIYKTSTAPTWPTFLNTYGIWSSAQVNFDYTVNVTFPTTNYYTFTGTGNQSITVTIGDNLILSGNSYKTVFDARAPIPAGTYPVRIRATAGTGTNGTASLPAVALQITNNAGGLDASLSYSGGFGGTAGGNGNSGAGGGGGGATLLFKNSTLIAVAGGGAGGGGGGYNSSPVQGQDAPGTRGQEPNTTAGQNGTNKSGDGGGGGGGGGGYPSGNGGSTPGGDSGGYAGMYGGSVGTTTYIPNGIKPGGASLPVYNGTGGYGGLWTTSGSNGYAVLEFDPISLQVNAFSSWQPVEKTYIKFNNQWNQTKATFVKSNGVWTPFIGTSDDYAPNPVSVFGNYGINPRPGVAGEPGGGGGGCCVVSTAFADQGIWSVQQKHDLIAWCEDRLHNHALGECFRRGYQVVGSKAGLPLLKTSWGKKYAKWAFDNGTRMVRGKSFAWWSVPNSVLWITAFMLVGSVVTTKYANRCWKEAAHKGR